MPTLLSLPSDILVRIVRQLRAGDLSHLVRVNRGLATVLNPELRQMAIECPEMGFDALLSAASNENIPLVRFYISHGLNDARLKTLEEWRNLDDWPADYMPSSEGFLISRRHQTALLTAAMERNETTVRVIYETNIQKITAQNYLQQTVLHMAASNRDIGPLEYLIRNGADTNAHDRYQQTPLHHAAAGWSKSGHKNLKTLIQNGAEANALDFRQRTPLHLACIGGSWPKIKTLLKNQADTSIRDEAGNKAFFYLADSMRYKVKVWVAMRRWTKQF